MTNIKDAKSVFLAATERDTPAERAAFLEEACGSDLELRQRVEALLRAHDNPDSFLEKPAVAANEKALSPTMSMSSIAERPGTVIGPYKLLQQIGEGGMGVVYLAEQQEAVRRKVALKIIKPGMNSRQVIARFEAERQALAMMEHQSIARVLDAGTTDTGRPYFVMELVKGVAITEYCDQNRLAPRERLELFIPVCQAIQHAHQKGIIHRDIKPSNVLVSLYDGRPVPKVIDFGVAKAIEQRLTEKTMFTQYGQVVGTLEYMSPEQAEMNQLDVDTRSDIYALGVLLYELLTGSTPITKEQLRQAGFAEMLRLIRESEPERPSLRLSHSHDTLPTISAQRHMEPSKLGALLRGELDWIVMKALEKDRTRRYESASGFARDIERYLNDEQVEACPPSTWYRMKKIARKHRKPIAAAAIIVSILNVLLVVYRGEAIRATRAETRAVVASQRARDAEQAARHQLQEATRQKARAEQAEGAAKDERDRAVEAEQRATASRAKAVEAMHMTLDSLGQSLYQQARAVLETDDPGRRWTALELLHAAENLRERDESWDGIEEILLGERQPDFGEAMGLAAAFEHAQEKETKAELRTQAVKALLLRDGRVVRHWDGLAHAVSPDGRYASSMAVDLNADTGALAITDLESGQELAKWEGKEAETMGGTMLALGPNAKRIAVVSLDMRRITVWNVQDKTKFRSLAFPKIEENTQERRSRALLRSGMIRQVVFSPTGQFVAAVQVSMTSGDSTLAIWDLDHEEDAGLVIAQVPKFAFASVQFSPDGKLLAFPSARNRVTVWNVGESHVAHEIELPRRTDGSLGFSPNENLLAIHCAAAVDAESSSVAAKSSLLLWDLAENRERSRIETGSMTAVGPVCFSPTGERIALAAFSTVLVLDATSGDDAVPTPQASTMTLDHGNLCQLLSWTNDGQNLISGGLGALKLWEFTDGEALTSIGLETGPTTSRPARIAFHPDNQTVAVALWPSGQLISFDHHSGRKLREFKVEFDERVQPFGLLYSPDGKQLVRLGQGGLVAWETETANERVRLGTDFWKQGRSVLSTAFRPSGELLVSGWDQFQPTVWEAATGNQVWRARGTRPGALAVLSPDAAFALVVDAVPTGKDRPIEAWDLRTNKQRFQLPTPDDKSLQVMAEISPDGRWILGLFQRGPATAQQVIVGTSGGHVEWTAIGDPDSEWSAKVWNAETGALHGEIVGPSSVSNYAFSPNGRFLAVGMRNGAIRIWDIDHATEILDWITNVAPDQSSYQSRHLAFTADSACLVVPDAQSTALHFLNLLHLNEQLGGMGLDW